MAFDHAVHRITSRVHLVEKFLPHRESRPLCIRQTVKELPEGTKTHFTVLPVLKIRPKRLHRLYILLRRTTSVIAHAVTACHTVQLRAICRFA